MVISEDFMNELKEKIDIEEIISEYVDIHRRGKNLVAVCPFHAERTPSFCIYPSSNSFYCFGCGAGGDVITFLRMIEHYDYIEAVKRLAERANMELQIDEQSNDIHNKKLLIYEMNREAAKFYHQSLLEDCGQKAREYLSARNISAKTVKHFGLGYAKDSGFALVNHLQNKGYKTEDIVLANLAFKNRSSGARDRFRNRLMIPIIDVRGNVIAFGARTLTNELPKYVNTSDTLVFKKSHNLFALNFAKNSGNEEFILTEGYLDAISLHQSGFAQAVAGLGTALTSDQVKLLSRYCNRVVLSYDSDEAGKKAATRAMEMLRNNGIDVKILSIPQAKDPDEYIRKNGKDGIVRFKNLIQNSKNDIEFKISEKKKLYNLETSEGKIKYLTEASKILASSSNAFEREIYASKISEELGINKSTILSQIDKYYKQMRKSTKKKEFKDISKTTSALNDKINKDKHDNLRAACAEENLISCIVNNQDIAKNIFSEISEDMFVTEFNRRLFVKTKQIFLSQKSLDITSISADDFSIEEIGRISKIISTYQPSMGAANVINEYIEVLKSEKQKLQMKNLNDLSDIEINKYINELKNTKNK